MSLKTYTKRRHGSYLIPAPEAVSGRRINLQPLQVPVGYRQLA
jgi:hypothetical protein